MSREEENIVHFRTKNTLNTDIHPYKEYYKGKIPAPKYFLSGYKLRYINNKIYLYKYDKIAKEYVSIGPINKFLEYSKEWVISMMLLSIKKRSKGRKI